MTRTTARRLGACLALTAALSLTGAHAAVSAAPADSLPTHLDLPNGFQPEGIALGPNKVAYLGSRADGDIYELDLRTGEGSVLSQGPGTPSLGLKLDRRQRLFVAGGTGGDARVLDTVTGKVLRSYQLVDGDAFINDVVLTKKAAYFTDSMSDQVFALPLGKNGTLPKKKDVLSIPLSGEWEQVDGLNANGISTTPDGSALLLVNSTTGRLFRVDPSTGDATVVDLDGTRLKNGDGLLIDGRTLYAVQNALNKITVLKLSKDGTSGTRTGRIKSGDFDVPTTVARSGCRLYLPNARFTTPPEPDTEYWVTQVRAARPGC